VYGIPKTRVFCASHYSSEIHKNFNKTTDVGVGLLTEYWETIIVSVVIATITLIHSPEDGKQR